MRVALITLGTTLSTVAVIANAFYQKKQFYPSIVYLTKSNPSIAVLYAQVFVFVLLFGKAMRKIFFGQLRAAEVEHLIEKFWYVITETCLAFTVFRDDFSPRFVALFTFLLFTKAFHWLIEDRVDYMERSPIITKLFHLRVTTLLVVLGLIDAILIHHALRITISTGASVQMVFGFEYAILLMMVVTILMKYVLHSIDYLSEHPWENKNVYLLYAELITGFIKCLLYILFVGIMVKIHTFPLFAIRPMYLTIRGFKKSLSDVILSRRAIAYMNTRFPDATEEELQQNDNTCIICREAMATGKKLPCNHIFHPHCLRSWFQRQQSCPTCRLDVLSQTAPPTATPPQQQQPQQQPQQPPPPNAAQQQPVGFAGMPPPMPPNFMAGIPPVVPSGLPPAVSVPGDSSGTGTTSTSSLPCMGNVPPFVIPPQDGGSMGFPMGAGLPPMFMTPPPFMGSPFVPPVFSPPNMDTSTLTLEQLQRMEGQERANVEARLNVLRNVHALLDVAIVQLNQYSQVISSMNAMSSAMAASPPAEPGPSTTSASPATTSIPPTHSAPSSQTPLTPPSQTPPETIETVTATHITDDATIRNSDTSVTSPCSEENEVRRRRLEKFSSVKKEEEHAEDSVTPSTSSS